MTRPIEMLLEGVAWTALPAPVHDPRDEGIPFVTHEGVLCLGDLDLRVFQLNTGQRVIAEESMRLFLDALGEGQDGA